MRKEGTDESSAVHNRLNVLNIVITVVSILVTVTSVLVTLIGIIVTVFTLQVGK